MLFRRQLNRASLSWAMYDWANSAFATTVIAGLFPVFFKEYWYGGDDPTRSTLALGIGNSVSGLLVAICAPLLGAIADRGSAKRRFLFTLAFIGMALTGGLYFVAEGHYLTAIIVYVAAVYAFMSANTFYDSLLVSVSDESTREFISAFGYAMGYLGGGLLFALNVLMVTRPEWFGIADASHAVRLAFASVAVWWAVFSVPLLLFVKEPETVQPDHGFAAVRAGLGQLFDTVREIRHFKVVVIFLLAYWLYIDGVHTMVRMAVDYGLSLGFDPNSLIVALLITQFVGFPATIAVGKLGEKVGAKRVIFLCIAAYIAVAIWGYFMTKTIHFYFLAATIGLAQGGTQALSRSLYIQLIPKNHAAQFFGFYNMLGKFAAVLGPALVGVVSYATGSPRLSILSLLILFVSGLLVLRMVDTDAGARAVQEFEQRKGRSV